MNACVAKSPRCLVAIKAPLIIAPFSVHCTPPPTPFSMREEGGATFRTRPGGRNTKKGEGKGLIYFQKERESLGQLRFRNSFNRTITLCVSPFRSHGRRK
ncbi:hypothetical protein CDAR_57881 [Caerostris darwini]|uniref:Secreted protein n=1 Tax=Caerostris darwini TaxID=1538125 RepID=A0AAV4T1B2_9ARAC|nr:hypothetical protein CDAR_57881 [Caerostris darwini]